MALYLRTIAPVGEGLTGRGMEHPPPLSRRVTEDVFPCEQSINPRLPASSRGLPPVSSCHRERPSSVHPSRETLSNQGGRLPV